MPVADIVLPIALEGPLSYAVPEGMAVGAGDYVEVPLGPRRLVGVVWGVHASAPQSAFTLRPLAARLDVPPMTALHRTFLDWVAAYYVVPRGLVLRLSLRAPGALGGARALTALRLTGALPRKMTTARQRVLDVLADGQALRPAALAELAATSPGVISGLVKEAVLETVKLAADKPFAQPDPDAGPLELTAGQNRAAESLRIAMSSPGATMTLLDGVTGSGKTEVFFEIMADVLRAGGQVLLLLPEIALTQTFLRRLETRFGAEPALWHSDMSARQRECVWRGVASGEARIVTGARSALFLPWANLRLIVVDEEHEAAYKQEEGIAYQARDMAVVYGSLGLIPVVLSSATPSLESLVNVDRGRYGHVLLKDRHGRPELPPVDLIDMRAETVPAGSWLSPTLSQALDDTLARGEQALLFLNRRGYAPLTLCRTCGHRVHCPNCAATLTEHRFRRQLLCHHCGHFEPVPAACPSCLAPGSLVPCGPGIERLAEEVALRFPNHGASLLSSDLAHGAALRHQLSEVAAGSVPLVIGTQLVAKGHHFPHLTLVGVVDGDMALDSSDPRAGERTFALMTQVAGRAGRGALPGRALIQTWAPDHPLMLALTRGDRDGYLSQEKAIREAAGLPPYGRLAALIISGSDAVETERLARTLWARDPASPGISLLGPAPAPIAVLRGRHRWRLLVKANRHQNIQDYLRCLLGGVQVRGSLRIDIDMDPYNFL